MTTGFLLVTIGILLILVPIVNLYLTTFKLQDDVDKWQFLAAAVIYVWLAIATIILGIAILLEKACKH